MDIRFHSTVLITRRLDEMNRFYTGLLGQKVRLDFGSCVTLECGLTLWEAHPGSALTRTAGGECRQGNGSLEVCFETEDFDTEAARMKNGGVPLLHDVAEEPWGQRTMRFYDPRQYHRTGRKHSLLLPQAACAGAGCRRGGEKDGSGSGSGRGVSSTGD